jgi:DNA-3-methyladenine glycosylase I
MKRCAWCGNDPLYVKYHDEEWGVPVLDDVKLFEFIVLESAQAGLSWITILKRREGYRKAFKNFNVKKVVAMGENDIERLLQDSGIIRNRLKIAATVKNAQAFIAIQKEFGSFAAYFWGFAHGKPIQNRPKSIGDLPAVTPLAVAMAKDLKKRGFSFLGPTIWYAHMQACGMVNDHVTECFRAREVRQLGKDVVLSQSSQKRAK